MDHSRVLTSPPECLRRSVAYLSIKPHSQQNKGAPFDRVEAFYPWINQISRNDAVWFDLSRHPSDCRPLFLLVWHPFVHWQKPDYCFVQNEHLKLLEQIGDWHLSLKNGLMVGTELPVFLYLIFFFELLKKKDYYFFQFYNKNVLP